MKKTLILVPDLSLSGGVSNYYRTLRLDKNEGIAYFVINKGGSLSAVGTALRLLRNYFAFGYKVVKEGYQTVVVNPSLDQGKSFHRDLVFVFLSRLLRRKTIVFFRGWLDSYEEKIKGSAFKKFLFRNSYAKADHFIVLGDLFRKKLINLGVSAEKSFTIETTVADSNFLSEFDLQKKLDSFKQKLILLFLSRVEKEKGLYIALDAYKNFVDKFPERASSFVVAGDGMDLSAVKKYVADQNIPNVNFLGNVSADRKKKVLLESHVMILPSLDGEGLPNSILEGMLYGMPVLSRITGGIPDVICQGKNGYLTSSLQSSPFTDFLSLLSSDTELYRDIAETNHSVALKKYTSEKVKERMLKMYQHF